MVKHNIIIALISSISALVLGVLLMPTFGLVVSVEVAMTWLTGGLLLWWALKIFHQRQWAVLIAGLSTPSILWLLFGIGGLVAMARVDDMRYFGPYEDLTVLTISGVAAIAGLAYVMAFHLIYSRGKARNTHRQHELSLSRISILTFLFVFIDWSIKVQQLLSGQFFVWMEKIYFRERTTISYHVERTIWPLVIVLLVYLFVHHKRKILIGVVLSLHLILIGMRGDRSDILFSAMILITSAVFIASQAARRKLLTVGVLYLVIFFVILSPMIQEARFLMRADAEELIQEPWKIPFLFVSRYLPMAATTDVILGESDLSYKRVGLIGRAGSYMSYAASMYQSMLDGRGLRPIEDFKTSLLVLIPRTLYPGKPSIDADAALLEYYGIGIPGHDSNGTPLADIFSYLHLPGVIILFLIGGLGYGLVADILEKDFGMIGVIFLLGFLPLILPAGDAYTLYLANLRNILLLLIFFKIVLNIPIPLKAQLPPH